DAERLEGVRGALRLVEQVLVGDRSRVARLALPVVGDLRPAARLDVAIQAVLRDVQLAADEPLRVRRLPLEHLRERLPPEQGLRLLRPETLEIALRALVDARVLHVRLRRERGRRREAAVLLGEGLERGAGLCCHAVPSREV